MFHRILQCMCASFGVIHIRSGTIHIYWKSLFHSFLCFHFNFDVRAIAMLMTHNHINVVICHQHKHLPQTMAKNQRMFTFQTLTWILKLKIMKIIIWIAWQCIAIPIKIRNWIYVCYKLVEERSWVYPFIIHLCEIVSQIAKSNEISYAKFEQNSKWNCPYLLFFFCSDSDSDWHTIAKTLSVFILRIKRNRKITFTKFKTQQQTINRRPSLFNRKTKLCVVRWCYKSDSRLYAVLSWELLLIVQSNQPVSHWLYFSSSSKLCAHQNLIKFFFVRWKNAYQISCFQPGCIRWPNIPYARLFICKKIQFFLIVEYWTEYWEIRFDVYLNLGKSRVHGESAIFAPIVSDWKAWFESIGNSKHATGK